MREKGMDDVLLFGGGIIPEADIPNLRKHGVERVFPPGAPLEEITKYVREAVPRKRAGAAGGGGGGPGACAPARGGAGGGRASRPRVGWPSPRGAPTRGSSRRIKS